MPDPVVPDDRGVSGTKEVVDDDVFSDAFDKAEEAGDKADLSVADDPKNLKEEDKEEPPVKTDAKITVEAQAAKDAEEAAKAAPVDDAAKMEQKYKTLQGIHRHDKETWEQERTRLQADLEEAKKPKTPKEETPKKEETAVSKEFEENLTDEQKAELDLYEENFDVVSKMEGLKRDRELKRLRSDLQAWKDEITAQITATKTQLEPALTLVQDRETEAHFDAIRDGYTGEDGNLVPGHADYEQYVNDGSLKAWIETKPGYIRRGMERVYSQGSVQDAIDLLSDFKRENNIQASDDVPDNVVDLESRKATKKAALAAVPNRKVAVASGKAFVDDYEGAFDEALNKSGG